MMKKITAVLTLLAVIAPPCYAAEQGETERLMRKVTPPLAIVERKEGKKDEMYFDCYYEPSDILQGNRTGHWTELTTLYGYTHNNINGYVSISQLERFDNKDYTANIGSYISLKNSYVHLELGFGWLVDYIYRLQSIADYTHKLYENMYWQVGYSYRGYSSNDTHLVYPGLIYYFGDSYMSANWGVSYIESRDTANLGTIKGDFAITKFLRWSAGISVGQRIYDIYEMDAKDEFGFVLFTGFNINIYKGISARLGYSYSEEQPKFIKRSVSFALSAKF